MKPIQLLVRLPHSHIDRAIHAMNKAFNHASYDDVKTHAIIIYDRIRGVGGSLCLGDRRAEQALGGNLGLKFLLGGSRKSLTLE